MGTIDRIRYYDGEFLRAFDFSDEQTYHMEMRRRLNRYLHLYGIVQGLQLQGSTQGGVTQVSILSGMAIDAYGREIYVFQPYTLGDADITSNRISQAGNYDVWLRYNKTPTTPPSAGYGSCNQMNQYTRWGESFSVILLPSPSSPFSDPGFAVDDTDDPSQDKVGVLLGTVLVNPTSSTATFSNPQFDPNPNRCVLLGLIAQRIQTPTFWDATQATPPFSFLNANPAGVANTPLSPPSSLEIESNIFADQNLIVGSDFPLTTPAGGPTVQITPKTTVIDPGRGSVKIAGDLFVQGNIYNLITSNTATPTPPSQFPPPAGTNLWLAINGYVQQLVQQSMPDFVSTGTPFPRVVIPTLAQTNAGVFSETVSIPINSKLSRMTTVVATAAIAGIEFNNPVNPNGVQLQIIDVKGIAGTNQCFVNVSYSVNNITALLVSPILSFTISASAVCFPS